MALCPRRILLSLADGITVTAVPTKDKFGTVVSERDLATRLILRIQDRFEALAPSEQKLAALLVEREDDLLTYSATELAKLAGVSKATAARLFRSLGYRDFNDVRLQAREERNRTAPTHRVLAPIEAPKGASSISTHLQTELANLTRTFEELASDRLRLVGQALAEAPRVWVLGLGAEEGVARYARLLLARIRPGVHLLSGAAGAWAEDMAMMGPKDALFAVAFRPFPRQLMPMLDWSCTSRVKLIAITDPTTNDRLRRLGAITLTCHVVGHTFGPSQTSATSLVRLMANATAELLGNGASRRMELIGDIHDELQDQD